MRPTSLIHDIGYFPFFLSFLFEVFLLGGEGLSLSQLV